MSVRRGHENLKGIPVEMMTRTLPEIRLRVNLDDGITLEDTSDMRSVVNRDLQRYYAIQHAVVEQVTAKLTDAELLAMTVFYGARHWSSFMEDQTAYVEFLPSHVEEARKYQGLHETFGFDAEQWSDKIGDLCFTERLVLIDAAERAYIQLYPGESPKYSSFDELLQVIRTLFSSTYLN